MCYGKPRLLRFSYVSIYATTRVVYFDPRAWRRASRSVQPVIGLSTREARGLHSTMHSCSYRAVFHPWTPSWVQLTLISTFIGPISWYVLGGGLAVGTVLLIGTWLSSPHVHVWVWQYCSLLEEDVLGSYSRVLMKMFLSEGVMCGHSLFLASASEDPAEIIKVSFPH